MSTSSDSFDLGESVPVPESTHSLDDKVGRLNSAIDSPIFNDNNNNSSFGAGDGVFAPQPSIYCEYENGGSDSRMFPPPTEMVPEERFTLREWRRENAIRLEEKEKKEKEILNRIIEEAEEYKVEFYKKRIVTCKNNKATNRQREKLFVANRQKFHAEADKNYWKAIAELIPNEVAAIEKNSAKKHQDKKPSIVVIQGPKSGKPTDLSRLLQILIKLKHNSPAHLKLSPPSGPVPAKDAKITDATGTVGTSKAAVVATHTELVAAA